MRKKFLLMTFLLAIIGFCGTSLSAQVGLQITTEQGLRDFAVSVNGGNSYYGEVVTLANDITLTGEWTPIGTGSRSSKSYSGNAFKGTFDGGDHTISGLTITSTSGADAAVGLFGIVDGGTVKNLNLTNVSINVTNSNLAGAAIGMMLNGATADNITVSGAIVGNDGVGGIVGRLIIHGTISNCINNASVTSSYGGIGGIVGKPYYEDGANTSTFASITNCTNNGTVTAPMYIGGIAGLARANVTDCINNGAVVGGTQTGGIIGQLMAAGIVSGNENKAKVSGKNHLGGIIGDYSQSSAYTYNNVSIANNINRGELAATEQCAAIMGCNNIDGFTAMTATGNVSYYYVEGLEMFGNPEDMVIDATNEFIIPVAQVGEQTFYTFAEAADAAQAGSEIKLLANIEGDITVPANVTLNGNGFAISGGILAEGDITFAGVTTAADFDANVANTAVNIPAGASLQLTGSARLVIGHGATFNITGTIEDAKTADKATLVPSLKIAAGASITGNGVTFNVNNAYIVANANTTSKNSNANGTLDFNIDNSIWEQTGVLAFYVPTSGMDPVVNFQLKNSVLTTTSHLVFSVTKGEIVIDNSLVNQGTSRQIENRSTMTIKNGSVVNGAVATSSNAINPGTIIVENATYAVTGEFSGSDLGTGTLIMKNGASFTAGKITKANIQIDATGMAIGDEINLTADLSNHAGTLEVINNDNLDAEIINGKIVLVEKPVAKIGETEYATLQAALNAAAQTEELTTIQLLAGTHTFGNVKFPATLKNVTIVGADNKATIIKDSKLYSADGNAVTYKGITFDGIVFDNSSILFTGARNGEVVYEDWTIKKCDFRNLQSTDGIAAIHFNLAADETIKNFTFEKNTITNVTSPSNTASGLRLNYVTGDVVIKDNETNNVAFNAVQIINSEVDNFTFEGNILRSNGSSLANLYNVTGENIVITKNQFLANENQESVSNIEYADVSGNYWGGGAPTNLPEGVVYSSYYTTVESDGTLGGLVELPQGDQPIGYVSETTIWGETWSNARTSYVIKVKDAEGNVMGTSTLNPELYTFNGNAAPTWHISFDPSTDNDTYWIQEWTTVPSINNMPAKVALWVDGVEVNEGPVKFNSPDDINKIYAATADAEGKLIRFYNSIETIVNNEENVNVVLVRDVTGSFETFHNVTLYSGVEGGASITNTYSADYTNFNKVIVKDGVTLNMNNVFSTTAESVNTIEGTMNVVGVYYHSSDAKTEIKNGGKVTTGGMTIVRYNNNPESGIYIYGDGDDATIEFSCQGDAIGAYSGTFYAENAVVETKGLRLDYKKDNSEESDEYAQINAKFVDTKLSVSSELRLYKDAALTLNGATVTAGKVQIRENATPTINIDNSTIKANSVENLSGATWNAVMDEDGYVTFVRTALAGEGTEANPYLINDISDLEFLRDDVNAGNNYQGKYVALADDIDLNNQEWTPIGNNTNQFQGYFDGNNKTIKNLKVSGSNRYVGLFGYIKGQGMSASTTPSVKDLTLENVNVSGDYFVGGLSGQAYTCNITNVTVKGEVSGVRYVGGLVGHVYTYFKDCHFIGNASCSFDALGGIAGAGDCRAYDCSVIGDVTGSNWVGGIVGNGQEGTSAVGCYVKGDIKTSNNYYRGVGGIAGVAGHGYASSEFKNNYFDGEVYLGDVKVPAMIMGLVNANDNASIKATVEGNSWNTDYYDVNTPVYVVAEISSSDASLEDWIAGTSEELTKPRNNNLIMLESDLQYVTEEDYVIMSFSEVTEEQVEQALINNAVAKIGETTYTTLQKALDAAVAGTGNVTVEIIKDIDLTNVDWNPVTVSGPNYPVVTVNGNDYTITGLNDMLFAGTWAGNSGLIIKNLTIENSAIVNDKDDTQGTVGVGAFIGYPQASATITLENCHLKNSSVEGGHWTGGLIGMAGGYSGNDGPVFMNLTITGCSVTGSTITGKGSAGGIIGHGSCSAWTNVVIKETTVSGNNITSTGTSTNKAGAIMGTIGAAGQPTTVNGVTHTGGATVSATVSGNTVKSNNVEITTIYGRQGTPTGMLELNGGSYDNYPIEEGVTYAAPAEGYKIEVNEDGTYGVVVDPAYGKVAKVGDVYYETLAEAYNAATDGQTITLLNNITLSEKFVIAKSITLDGNDMTLTYTGEDRAIDIYDASNNVEDVTIKNITIKFTSASEYCQRGINYNEGGNLTLDNVTVDGSSVVTYAVNLPSKSTGANVTITNSNITGKIALNVWGANAEINATGSDFTSVDDVEAENYAAVKLNNNGTDSAEGAEINITGGSITAKDENGELSSATTNATATGRINISETTEVIGNIVTTVAIVTYEGASEFYSFSTLQAAIDKAGDDSKATVKLLRNVETSELIKVEKAVVIDLNGKTVTANCKKAFEVYANATIKNGAIEAAQRCVDTRKAVELTLTDVTLIADEYTTHGNPQPLTIGGSENGTKVVMTNVNISAAAGYGIITFVETELTANESVISGYSALYVKPGSDDSEFNFVNSDLSGGNIGNDVEGNSFSTIAVRANNVAVNVDAESTVTANGNHYYAISFIGTSENTTTGSSVTVAGEITGNILDDPNGNTVKVKAEYADELAAAGYATIEAENGLVSVIKAVAKIDETCYATLQDAFNAATEDKTIIVLENVELENTVTVAAGKVVTLDLNGKNLTGGAYVNLYINGELTIEDNVGNAVSTFRNHYVLNGGKLTLKSGILQNIETNTGGYGIFIDEGGESTIEGGTVQAVNESNYAICVKGTLTIVDGNIVGKHGVIAVENPNAIVTIKDGEYTLNAITGNSDHIVYVTAGMINIEGGNFTFNNFIANEGDSMIDAAEENVSITGGTYTQDVNEWCAEGYEAVQIDDNVYEVRIASFEKFYTAEGVETTQDQAAYSLMFNVTDNENNELSVKIGNKKPAQNSSINLVTPVTATFDGITFNVTSVADNGFNSTRFKTVTISEGVATIGTKALANMSALTDIVFPSTLKSIGDNCFYGYGENHKIKTITCYAEEAPVAASHYTEVPFQMVICKVAALIVPNAVSYEEYATAPGWSRFYEEPNGGLINHILGIGTEIEIAGKDDKYTMIATITSMDPMECSIKIGNTKPAANSNAELVIPTSVDFVESIEGLDFTVTSIPKDAFKDCKNFVGDLVIPAAVRTIGYMAFNASHNANAGSLIFADGCELTTIDAWAFNNSFKGDFQLPASITSIGVSAFANNGAGNTLTITAENSGYGRAFAGSKFIKLVVEEGVKSLPGLAFLNTNFTEVVLPLTLETMSGSAFHETKTIRTITVNAAVPPTVQNANNYNAFEQEVFYNATLFVPDHAAKALYKEANVWKEFVNISTPIITQTTQLNAGWNWFSYYVNTDLETLEKELGESAAQIKSHTQGFDIYAGPEAWSGTLDEILPEQMYMIKANEPSTLNLKGETIDHENVEITLVKDAWNWIGYPINGSVNLSDAFNGVDLTIGDQIKSHNHGFAYYIGNNTWAGGLQVLVKGEGYMYHNTSSENDVVFTYNVPQGKSNSELKSNITTNGNYWIPNASQYPNNMTMTAMVDVEGGDYEVAAFVDGEVRGSARPIYVEPIDAYVLFLTIHGEGVEEMTFKFYDLTTGEEFDLNDRMNYSDDAIVGSLKEPYIFNRGTTGIGEASLSDINIYPNPTTTGTEINLQATCDTVEVFNALGVKVAEYQNVDSIDAFETAGIYVIRITDNGDVKHCRLIVK
ncbi:MAG: T9SS type A sorting domain-containing protein [Lentimicrobiaceae bacterium]|nr:T9SS type A sorting domain-containing protein [Lentimicrobiaceae bacterium]